MPNILTDEVAPQVLRVTLNRPEALNGFSSGMYPELLEILQNIARDPKIRVVVLTGAGRGFCSGNDGTAMNEQPWVPENVGKIHYGMHFLRTPNAMFSTLRRMPQPVIAAVNGPAAGLGYSLALACDIAIAGKSAKFVNAFHNAGTGSEFGLSYLLPRTVGMQRAAELLLTARPVLAEEAERIGLVLRSVPDDQLMDEVLKISREMILNAPLDLWVTKQNMYTNLNAGSLEQAILLESRSTLMAHGTEDAEEKRAARREKRAPKFSNR